MSPEVLIRAGIPCCRLVQNAGEFVVTFPGAYHSGFSHGFNCGEAANIATPEWLRVAKEAAIRRASTNYPPMVSHFQLLYALAMSLCSRMPVSGVCEPRSSRLKDKMKGEAEMMVKEIFVENVMETNKLQSLLLEKVASCIVLPKNSSSSPLCSNSLARSQLKMKPRLSLGLCSREEALEASRNFPSSDVMLGKNSGVGQLNSSCPANMSVCHTSTMSDKSHTGASDSLHVENGKENPVHGDGILDKGLLSCVTCGILSFTCVAVVHPSEEAARYLMSSDCGFLNDQNDSKDITDSGNNTNRTLSSWDIVHGSGQLESHASGRDDNKLTHYFEDGYDDAERQGVSALTLLASAYGESSDSEEEHPTISLLVNKVDSNNEARFSYNGYSADFDDTNDTRSVSLAESSELKSEFSNGREPSSVDTLEDSCEIETSNSSIESTEVEIDNPQISDVEMGRISSEQHDASYVDGSATVTENTNKATFSENFDTMIKESSVTEKHDKDSSRMHVFCLEHALEVEKLLRPFGGVNIMLLCHPDYPKIEGEAKLLAEELKSDYEWKNIDFREASVEDQQRIRAALEDEESIPTNSDWAVKLGINLHYSANLSRSPLYSKQMPYNAVIYRAFGCCSPKNSPVNQKLTKRNPGKQKKTVVAGKWCGKVWMSNQVHPYLAQRKEREIADNKFLSQNDTDTNTGSKCEEVETQVEQEKTVSIKKLSGKKTSAARRSGKRKKKPLAKEIAKKLKCTPQVLDKKPINSEILTQTPSTQSVRVLRSCRKLNLKYEADEVIPSKSRSSSKVKNGKDENEIGSTEADGGPSTRLRTRSSKAKQAAKSKPTIIKKQSEKREVKKGKADASPKKEDEERADDYTCDVEGCLMSFSTKSDLTLHKKDICPEKGCGKKFFSHKYLLQHRKVHMDDRPLGCPWKGCKMRFKWAWARTEHIRVHTGDRPYVCRECSETFRFVSDFSRHKRKTGHVVKKVKGRR